MTSPVPIPPPPAQAPRLTPEAIASGLTPGGVCRENAKRVVPPAPRPPDSFCLPGTAEPDPHAYSEPEYGPPKDALQEAWRRFSKELLIHLGCGDEPFTLKGTVEYRNIHGSPDVVLKFNEY